MLPAGPPPPGKWRIRAARGTMEVMMQHAKPAQNIAISDNHMSERWLAISLLASSLALVAWCVVTL